MKKLTEQELSKLKSIELDILIEVDRICKKNDIKYSLAHGTLIGAVRHKGFIPWDDDIDIMMERKEYTRFLQIATDQLSNKFYLTCFEYNENYALPFAKVMAYRTVMQEVATYKSKAPCGAWVDLFPIDISPKDDKSKRKQYEKGKKINSILFCKANYSFGKTGVKLLLYRIRKLAYLWMSHTKLVDMFNENATKYIEDENRAREVVCLCDNRGVKKATFEKSWFDNYVPIEFEKRHFMAIGGYHQYLSQIYGDYMRLPPLEDRIPHHFVQEICLDDYFNN